MHGFLFVWDQERWVRCTCWIKCETHAWVALKFAILDVSHIGYDRFYVYIMPRSNHSIMYTTWGYYNLVFVCIALDKHSSVFKQDVIFKSQPFDKPYVNCTQFLLIYINEQELFERTYVVTAHFKVTISNNISSYPIHPIHIVYICSRIFFLNNFFFHSPCALNAPFWKKKIQSNS